MKLNSNNLPKYLIWYWFGENQEKLISKQIWEEFSTKEAFTKRVDKLTNSKLVTRLKYKKL